MSDADAGAAGAARPPPPLSRPPAMALPPLPHLPAVAVAVGRRRRRLPPQSQPSELPLRLLGRRRRRRLPSFSQPLAGAMGSPPLTPLFGGAVGRFLPTLPRFLSPVQGHMGMSHQQALTQVTVEALQNQSQIQIGNPVSQAMETATSSHPSQQVSLGNTFVDKHIGDSYNWRNYGQKRVKGSEYPRSYYKCSHPNCPVKKKVARSLDGQVIEIIYKGQHNHQKPQSNRRGKEGAFLSSESVDPHEHADLGNNSEMVLVDEDENANRSPEFGNSSSVYRSDQELGHVLTEQFSDSAGAENGGDAETDRQSFPGGDAKTRNMDTAISTTRTTESSGPQKEVAEPTIIVQTTSEVDLLDDGYRWQKNGRKVVKGHTNPRSYYKCTSAGCNVRKHVERASTDPKDVVTTYKGRHNHDIPTAKNSSHSTANNGIRQSKPENRV